MFSTSHSLRAPGSLDPCRCLARSHPACVALAVMLRIRAVQEGTLKPLSLQPGLQGMLGSPRCSLHLAVLGQGVWRILSLPLAPQTDGCLHCLCSWIEERWLQLIPGRSRRCRRLRSRYGGDPKLWVPASPLGLLGHMCLPCSRLGASRGSHRGCSWMQLRVSGSHSGADQTLQPCSSDRRNSEVWCWKGTGNTLLHCAPLTCCCTRGSWCAGWGSRAPRAGQGGGTQQWVPLLFSSAHHPLHFPIWHSSDGSPP